MYFRIEWDISIQRDDDVPSEMNGKMYEEIHQ